MRTGAALILVIVGSILTTAIGINTTYGLNINTVSLALMIAGDVWAIAEIAVASDLQRLAEPVLGRTAGTQPSRPY